MKKGKFRPIGPVSYAFLLIATMVLNGSWSYAGSNDIKNNRLPDWLAGALSHARKFPANQSSVTTGQPTPAVIPAYQETNDDSGALATFRPSGSIRTSGNPFFQNLGSNGRTCFTCHQPQEGWTVSPSGVQARFLASGGMDPIFRPIDGATCPTDDVSTPGAMARAYSLLLNKGLIRVFVGLPANPQFQITSVDDPYGCNTNPATGLTSPTTGVVSVYRRPLPSTNLGFLSTIMWDGREPSLSSQAIDATLIHAQGGAAPNAAQQAAIVSFESGLYTAQTRDLNAGQLIADGADGGPRELSGQQFFIGINDPLGLNPTGAPFNPDAFTIYAAWESLSGGGQQQLDRESVGRGEKLFNEKLINIIGVRGLNDATGQATIAGTCTTCHDSPNVGDHSVKAPLDIGVTDDPAMPRTADMPLFTLQCTQGPLTGRTFMTTDPGRALITGKCADIAKVKGPILRGLSGRAPYFQAGEAATLEEAVDFYERRFGVGFTAQERTDLVNFLKTL